jgi:hypothetical protein
VNFRVLYNKTLDVTNFKCVLGADLLFIFGKKINTNIFIFSELSWILIPIIFFGCGTSEKDINFAKVIQNTKDKGWFVHPRT